MKPFRIVACLLPLAVCSCQTHIIHEYVPVKPKPKIVVVTPKAKPVTPKPVAPEQFENVQGIR